MESELDLFRKEWEEELAINSHTVNREVLESETQEEATHRQAAELYRRGAALERAGLVTEAMHSYREAFLLNPELGTSRVYQQEALDADVSSAPAAPIVRPRKAQDQVDQVDTAESGSNVSLMAIILSESADPESGLAIMPPLVIVDQDAKTGLDLRDLPIEIMLEIFKAMDVATVETAAGVCRLFYVLSRDNSVWRYRLSHRVSRPILSSLLPRVSFDWRSAYASCPLVQSHGLYIARETYYRTGSQRCRTGTIFSPLYEVTYWRAFRFDSDGTFATTCVPDHPASIAQWFGHTTSLKGNPFLGKSGKPRPVRIGQYSQVDGKIQATAVNAASALEYFDLSADNAGPSSSSRSKKSKASSSSSSGSSSSSKTSSALLAPSFSSFLSTADKRYLFIMSLKRFARPMKTTPNQPPVDIVARNASKLILNSYDSQTSTGSRNSFIDPSKPLALHFVPYSELARLPSRAPSEATI